MGTPEPLDLTRLFPDFSLDMARGVLIPLMDMALPPMRTRTTCGATRLPLGTTLARATPEPLDLTRLFPGFSLDMARGVLMPLTDMALPPMRTRTTCGATRLPLDTTLARAIPELLDLTKLFPEFILELSSPIALDGDTLVEPSRLLQVQLFV